MPLIEIESLRKVYKTPAPGQSTLRRLFAPRLQEVRALDGLSFSVECGEAVGYIGPNGSGKSTTMKCLTGVLVPDSGTVRVGGLVPWRERLAYSQGIGALFGQKSLLFWDLPVLDALLLYKSIYGLSHTAFKQRLHDFQEAFDTDQLLHIPVRRLSLGQRMRCELLAALLHSPSVLFLDEPTIGLDVVARDQFHRFLKRYQQQNGLTLMLTTHQVSDIEELCPRVILIQNGRVRFEGRLTDLKQRFGSSQELTAEYRSILKPLMLEELQRITRDFQLDKAARRIRMDVASAAMSRVYGLLHEAADIQSLTIGERPLEKILVEVYENESLPAVP